MGVAFVRGAVPVDSAAIARLLSERGCHLVEVTSNLRRTEAHAFWERLGYERTSARFARAIDS